MNKTKMKFMQNAPVFVIVGGFSALGFFGVVGIPMCLTDEWKFGLYAIALCVSAIVFLLWLIRHFEETYKTSLSDAMVGEKEYWKKHDK